MGTCKQSGTVGTKKKPQGQQQKQSKTHTANARLPSESKVQQVNRLARLMLSPSTKITKTTGKSAVVEF